MIRNSKQRKNINRNSEWLKTRTKQNKRITVSNIKAFTNQRGTPSVILSIALMMVVLIFYLNIIPN